VSRSCALTNSWKRRFSTPHGDWTSR